MILNEFSPISAKLNVPHLSIEGVPEGFAPHVIANLVQQLKAQSRSQNAVDVILCLRDTSRATAIISGIKFHLPIIEILELPAWDCLPYDRVSPTREIVAQRLATLSNLAASDGSHKYPRILITSVSAITQKLMPKNVLIQRGLSLKRGQNVNYDFVVRWLEGNGFLRESTVRETGSYAVRGGIIDLFPPASLSPFRLDFFGATLEAIRSFDVETQRSQGNVQSLNLLPTSELILSTETVKRFRQGYVEQFGGATRGDHLYEAISEGRIFAGAEHWLPLFYEKMDTILDYTGDVPIIFDHLAENSVQERLNQITDFYEARKSNAAANSKASAQSSPYKPLNPDLLYLGANDWEKLKAGCKTIALFSGNSAASSVETPSPLAGEGWGEGFSLASTQKEEDPPQSGDASQLPRKGGASSSLDNKNEEQRRFLPNVANLGAKTGRNFSVERNAHDSSVFEALKAHIDELHNHNKTAVLTFWTAGTRDRLLPVLQDHGINALQNINNAAELAKLPKNTIAVCILPLEHGYETKSHAFISEQDILGDRLVRNRRKTRKAEDYFSEISALTPGDIVVHAEHGIGQFFGLVTLNVTGAAHDVLELHYAGGDKLYVPVENLDLLTRYGSEASEAVLDRLGAGQWQARKAKMKQRIAMMAHELMDIAAKRALRKAPVLVPHTGTYDEFVARFPYEETDDQLNAIETVLEDLSSGKPMDRLICGDVGFGKTEVALRAAFVVAMSGKQVAVVVPTTLLARQHFRTFTQRFAGLPVRIHQASRMVSTKDLALTKAELKDGKLDIVVGTHALLAKDIAFKDLGLLIIDEEQHFGVAHKERLKALREDVHVLTLTATPIPRTLQLAFTGVRSLSIIATPPVDRLAVRTSIMPFDPLIVRETLLRERYRGGQAFYVCPRIDDLAEIADFLKSDVPEVRFQIAHGQMPPSQLEDIMTAFYEGQFDVLLSTTIVESGLDVPSANTLIIHRADMFGLAALYQLRGRVGRSKTRAFAVLTTPAGKKITAQAQRRLQVLESLDSLGAGFQLASHDLDIRGAGNLLGDEQSGHIREVGYELYQQMLMETIAALEAGGTETVQEEWSPQINLGTSVLIPDDFVPDLSLRLSLYRKLSNAQTESDIEAFGAEMIDRFGALPPEVQHLLEVMTIKAYCRRAKVAKVDTGPKGIVISFHNNTPPNLTGLVQFLATLGGQAKVRPDSKLVLSGHWPKDEDRTKATKGLMWKLAEIGEGR